MAAHKRHRSIARRRAERELFFWTAQKTLDLIRQALPTLTLLALTIYLLIALSEGRVPPVDQLTHAIHAAP